MFKALSQANIRNTFFDQSSPQHGKRVFRNGPHRDTDTESLRHRQTDGDGESMTLKKVVVIFAVVVFVIVVFALVVGIVTITII